MSHTPRLNRVVFAFVATLTLVGAATARANNIVFQGAGDTYVAWEAEDFYSINDPDDDGDVWTVIDDSGASASGGSALLSDSGSDGNNNDESHARYVLQFSDPGTYNFYMRFRNNNDVSSDSFFRPPDFDMPPTTIAGTGKSTTYIWGYYGNYTVSDPDDLDVYLDFFVGVRENGFRLDRLVLTQQNYGTSTNLGVPTQLEQLPNSTVGIPEPATLTLVLLGALPVLRRRRRG